MLDDHSGGRLSRQQRRADARRRAKAWPLPLSEAELATLGEEADRRARAAAFAQLGLDPALSDIPFEFVVMPAADGGVQELELGPLAAPLVAFAGQQVLGKRGVPARVVAGAAIWSVGSGRWDTLDHGVEVPSRDPALLAAFSAYHTWLDVDGGVIDLAARHLPAKLAAAHRERPFSTPPERWRRFPETIVHAVGMPMLDPERDAEAPYAYRPGGSELLRHVRRRLALALELLEGPDTASAMRRRPR